MGEKLVLFLCSHCPSCIIGLMYALDYTDFCNPPSSQENEEDETLGVRAKDVKRRGVYFSKTILILLINLL